MTRRRALWALALCTLTGLAASRVRAASDAAIEIVSVSTTGAQHSGNSRFGGDAERYISADGRYVAFPCDDVCPDLVPGDTNNRSDVFVRDRLAGTTVRVSVSSSGEEGNDRSEQPAISADGRFVVFHSTATNLVSGDTNNLVDVFLHDRDADENGIFDEPGGIATTRVSVSGAGAEGNCASAHPAISGNGRYVAFQSCATNWPEVGGKTIGVADIFVHDRVTATTIWASPPFSGFNNNHHSGGASISDDGRFVAFQSLATSFFAAGTIDASAGEIFVRDTCINGRPSCAPSYEWVSPHAASPGFVPASFDPSISGDGRFVAFDSLTVNLVPNDTNEVSDIFVFDRQAATVERVNVSSSGAQAVTSGPSTCSGSRAPSISFDGRLVVFESCATNLDPADVLSFNGQDIFVRDRLAGTTTLLSANAAGEVGNPTNSGVPAISSDGSIVAFFSSAANLVPDDTNGFPDVFAKALGFNRAPVAAPQDASTVADTPVTHTLAGSDFENTPLMFAITALPANGTLSAIRPLGPGAAEVDYTPNSGFTGTDTFAFTVNDGQFTSAAATVSVSVHSNNRTVVQLGGIEYRARDPHGVEQDVFVTFAAVNQPARLTAEIMTNPPAPPEGYVFLGPVYDVRVEPPESVSGPIDVCIEGAGFSAVQVVLHLEGSAWVDRTSSSTPTRMCARLPSLSPVGVATPAETVIPTAGVLPAFSTVTINAGVGDQTDPHVSDDLASYTDQSSDFHIRYFSFSSGIDQQIPAVAGASDFLSDVSSGRVAFTRLLTAHGRIEVFNVSSGTTTPVAADPDAHRIGSAIGDDTVAFVDVLAGRFLTAADLSDGTAVELGGVGLQSPAVSPEGDAIVWERCSSLLSCDIFKAVRAAAGWNTSPVAGTPDHESNPDSDGTWIVYDATRSGSATGPDIYFQPVAGGPETRVEMAGVQSNPAISRGVIVFESRTNFGHQGDVFVYVIATNTLYQVTSTPPIDETLTDVSVLANGDVRLVWAANDGLQADHNIYAATLTLAVPTTLTLAPVIVGASNVVTLTATLTSAGAPVAGRSIDFRVLGMPASPNASATTDAEGVATINVSLAAVKPGFYQGGIEASFAGDAQFARSSASTDLTIPKAATTLTLTASPNPATVGDAIRAVATVRSAFGIPSGEVRFRIVGGTHVLNIPPQPIANGVLTLDIPGAWWVGTGLISAEYLENDSYFGSRDRISVVVNQAATTTTLASSRSPSLTTAPPVFTATVTTALSLDVPPPGKVEFFADGELLCRSTLYRRVVDSAFVASCGGATLAPGTHTITATYPGTVALLASTATAITQVVHEGTYHIVDLASTRSLSSAATSISDHGTWITVNADEADLDGSPVRRAFLLECSAFDAGPLNCGGHRDIGTLGGPATFAADGADLLGFTVVGRSSTSANVTHAFMFDALRNSLHDLTPGAGPSAATAIGGSGVIIGLAITPTGFHAVSWPDGITLTDLGTLGGNESFAASVSDTGFIVGRAQRADGIWRAVRFGSGAPSDLGTLGGASSEARAINNAGESVGVSDLSAGNDHHAFLHDGFVMTDLGTLPNSDSSEAVDINDAGYVTGTDTDHVFFGTHVQLIRRAFLYANGVMTSLGPLGRDGRVVAISNAGMVIGSRPATTSVGLGFASNGQSMFDLGTVGGFESEPAAINDAGQIVGWSTARNGRRHATLWQPVPVSALIVAPASGVVGTSVRPSATLESFGAPIAGKAITFSLNGVVVGSATTDTAGRAWLGLVSIAGIAEGVHPDAIRAAFAGDFTLGASTATADLTVVSPLPPVVAPALAGAVESPVTIVNDTAGEQTDPHVSGDLASYTSGPVTQRTIRYFRFSTGLDEQIPLPAGALDFLPDVNDSRIAFTRVIADRAAIFVFDAGTSRLTEIDPQAGSSRIGSAIGGDTVAFIDYATGTGRLAAWNLAANVPSAARELDSALPGTAQSPNVSLDGSVIVWEQCLSSVTTCSVIKAVRSNRAWAVSAVAEPAANPDTDGMWIVYDSAGDIYVQPVSGGSTTRLEIPGPQLNPSISDGVIAFESASGKPADLFVYVMATGGLYQITSTPPITEQLNDIAMLPNGDVRLVWAANDGVAGDNNVYARTFRLTDATPFVSVGDTSVVEGNAGTTDLVFTVSLGAPSTRAVTVDFRTDLPAKGLDLRFVASADDYDAVSGTITFLPGETSKTGLVPIQADTLDEYDERFLIALENPVNALVGEGFATATIVNDDPPPGFTVRDAGVLEGSSGTTDAVFTITLSRVSGRTLGIDLVTEDGTATAADGDYLPQNLGMLFSPGDLELTFRVPVRGDTRRERNEQFKVRLSGDLGDAVLVGTIVNDDHPPNDAFADAALLSGPTGELAGIDTLGASREGGEPGHAGNAGGASVWYRWVAPQNGALTLVTDGFPLAGGGHPNTLLAAYARSPASGLTEIAGNDDDRDAPPFSRLTADVVAGTSYSIALDGFGGEMFEGNVTLRWSFAGGGIEAVTDSVRRGGTVTTDLSREGATAANPITTSVTTPVGGTVSVTEQAATPAPQPGFNVLGYEVSISAAAATPGNPLVIVFELHASILPRGSSAARVVIYRNGVPVADCVDPASGVANPDPCVRSREALESGNVRVTVLTSAASVWGFSTPNLPPTVTVPADVVAEATGPDGAAMTFAASAEDPEQGALAPTCTPGSGSVFPLGDTIVSCNVEDAHGASATGSFTVRVRDTIAPTIELTTPSGGAVYRLNQLVTASYRCADGGSGLQTCDGPVPSGNNIATGAVGTIQFAVHASDRAGNATAAAATYQVAYDTRLLYDATRAKKSGSTIPIKLQLCDAEGRNQSSADIDLTALGVTLVSSGDTGPAEDPGNANPDSAFRYDPTLEGGGYIFNLKTTGYQMGTYHLRFRAGNDPTVHLAEFRVR